MACRGLDAQVVRPEDPELTQLLNQFVDVRITNFRGVDMNRFPTDRHLASWAGLCHGHHESAGKQKSGKMRKGNAWLRGALIEAALGATRAKKSALAARYRRVMRHRGTQESRRRRRACLARDRLSSACPPDDLP